MSSSTTLRTERRLDDSQAPVSPAAARTLLPGSPFASSQTGLAYTPAPLSDEPLDGYLEHVAFGLGTDPMNLRRHFGLPQRLAFGAVHSLDDEQIVRLHSGLGLEAATLRAMTLQRYQHLGLLPRADPRGYAAGSWPRGRGARYCPECLRERDLRWRLPWYLQWSFACIRHQRLLLSVCPTCEEPVRTSPLGHPRGYHAGMRINAQRKCACPVEGLAASRQHLTPPTPPSVLVPILRAQHLLDSVLAAQVSTINSLGAARPSVEWLRDLATIVRLLVARLNPTEIAEHLGELLAAQSPLPIPDICTDAAADFDPAPQAHAAASRALAQTWRETCQLPETDRPTVRMKTTVLSPVITAFAATVAVHMLAHTTVDQARQAVGAFPRRGQSSTGEFVSKYGTSWELATVLRRDQQSSRPGATLAVRLVASRFDQAGQRRRPLTPSKVPGSIWPGLLQLASQPGRAAYQRSAASLALIAIASEAGLPAASAALHHPSALTDRLRSDLADLLELDTRSNTGTFAALLAVRDFLDRCDVPIDYARRRRTFTRPEILSRRLVRRAAYECDLRQTERLRTFMGWYVFELLTGTDILFTDTYLELLAGHRRAYANLRTLLNSAQPSTLLRVAERGLQLNHLDEPISWAPTRNADGTLTNPGANLSRHLSGWTGREGRGPSRYLLALDGRPLHEIVTLAERPQNLGEQRLRVDLARFMLATQTLDLTAASPLAGVTAGTMADAMRRLERRLGHRLLDRHNRGVTLTKPGVSLKRAIEASSIDPIRDANPERS